MDSDSSPPLIRDPFDDSSYLSSSRVSTSQNNDTEISTYGQLVNEIYNCGSKVLRYHDDYLKTRTSAPPEEMPQYEFVSKGDFLCAGRDFTVFAGHWFKDYNASPSFPQKRRDSREYGDHKFVRPSSGTTAGGFSGISVSAAPTRIPVALKESVQSINKSGNRPFVLGTFLKEVRLMGELKSCVNVVELFGVAFVEVGQEVKPTLVVELALGNLADFLRSSVASVLTWTLKLELASHVGAALQAVHRNGIVHADVKAQNVLVFPHPSTRFCAKLSDFGNCTAVLAPSPIAAGTRNYLAPECLITDGSDADYDKYGNSEYRDIYAFGLVVWEVATDCRELPFVHVESDEDMLRIKRAGSGDAVRILAERLLPDTPKCVEEIIDASTRPVPTRRASLDKTLDRLHDEISRTSLTAPASIPDDNEPSNANAKGADDNGEPLVKIPWSLQKRLYEESSQSAPDVVDSRVFLAYCYILCSSINIGFREDALRLLRDSAHLDPFHLAPGVKLTPLRAMMELQDWVGLSEILSLTGGNGGHSDVELTDRYLQHIYSFGWRRFIVLACGAGADDSLVDPTPTDVVRESSENVAVFCIRLLAQAGVNGVGQAVWGSDGFGALHMAAVSGKPRAVSSLLVASDSDPGIRDKDGRTPLHLCCQAVSLSESLSVAVAKAFAEFQPSSVNDVMKDTLYTPLRFAVEADKPLLCQVLLESGADANACAVEGSTSLQECAWIADSRGNGKRGDGSKNEDRAVALATVILTYGKTDINQQSCHNSVTALGVAAAHGNSAKMVRLLLDHGADTRTSVDDLTPLSAAVQHNNQEMISILLQKGADPNYSVRGVTPLGLAVGLDQHDNAQTLLEYGANTAPLHQGIPLACWAIHVHARVSASDSQDEVCPNLKLLLQHGASLTGTAQLQSGNPPSGWSVIHFVACSLSTTVLDFVLAQENPPSVTRRTSDGETALHVAVSYKSSGEDDESERSLAMLGELIRRGVDVNATDVLGETVLHVASRSRLAKTREYLIQAGCNPDIKHPTGRTAQELFELDEETLRREYSAMRRDAKRNPTEKLSNTGDAAVEGQTDSCKSDSSHQEDDPQKHEKDSSTADPEDTDGKRNGIDEKGHFSLFSGLGLTCLTCAFVLLGVVAYVRSSHYHR